MPDKNQNPLKAMALVGMIGIDLAVSVLLGVWLGNWLDGMLHTNPVFLIIGIFLGLGIGVWMIIKIIHRFNGESQ